MGCNISSACNSGILENVTQASCQFVINGIEGKSLDKIIWNLRARAIGDKNATYNIKLENLSKPSEPPILEETTTLEEQEETEWLKYSNAGINPKTQNWIGDTLKATITKQSGSPPIKLQIYVTTQTHYTN